MQSVHTKIGYRAQLECIVLASPSGTVHWYHHGLPVIMDNHIARSDVDVVGVLWEIRKVFSLTSLLHLFTRSPAAGH